MWVRMEGVKTAPCKCGEKGIRIEKALRKGG
jgi:hypothetical protein